MLTFNTKTDTQFQLPEIAAGARTKPRGPGLQAPKGPTSESRTLNNASFRTVPQDSRAVHPALRDYDINAQSVDIRESLQSVLTHSAEHNLQEFHDLERGSQLLDPSTSLDQTLPRLVHHSVDLAPVLRRRQAKGVMKGSRVVQGFYKGGSLLEYLGAKEAKRKGNREWMIRTMLREGDPAKQRATAMGQALELVKQK